MFRRLPLLLLLPLLSLGTARAEDDLPRCTCPRGNGCYHFLGAPVIPPDEPSPCPLDDVEPNATKFDLAKSEIAASLGTLDPRVRINLFFFRTEASAWKSKAVPASPRNVGSAVSRLETQRPGDGFGRKSRRTNYVDAFRLVLGAKRGEPQPAGFPETPDTIYFLTDGKPTVGDITEPEILLSWFQERNRFARIRVHVITFGRLEMNENFLRPLAERNGGRFVQVPEAE